MDPILDVTIGLVFFYLLLALMITVLTEAVTSFLRLRSRNLGNSLRQLLSSKNNDLEKLFNETGTIRMLKSISGRYFVQVRDAAGTRNEKIARLEPETFVNAILEVGKAAKNAANGSALVHDGQLTAADLVSAVAALPESPLRDSLLATIDDVGNSVDDVKARIGDWFDTMMETASARFKAAMQKYTFFCALLVAVGLNADTIHIAEALWKDDALRTQIAETAADYVADDKTLDDLADYEVLQAEMRPFPIGWDDAPPHSSDWYTTPSGILTKFVGWLLTALAISLGAPFWFDLLRKLVAIRKGRGGKPATN